MSRGANGSEGSGGAPVRRPDIFDRIMSLRALSRFKPFYERHREQLLYLFFGALTTLVNFLVFWLFSLLIDPLAANVIAWFASVFFAFVTNRTWVFGSGNKRVVAEGLAFAGGRLATLGAEELVLWVGIDALGWNAIPVKIAAQVLVLVGNYLISKFIVFRKKK
ncbi:MAG: GtrA family protein [Clostridia bacterium]|nr:GtrA family protein [Clostridia bacterium]